jgi:dihydroxyacetone kinase-like protein
VEAEADMGDIDGKKLVRRIVHEIEDNKAWLSEIDGAVGDGDHGVNMAKGFAMVEKGIDGEPDGLSDLLRYAGMTLLTHIGGAMGPIYGTFFMRMGKAVEGKKTVSAEDVSAMLSEALEGVKKRGGAEEGDKTLVDTLASASRGVDDAIKGGADAEKAIDAMIDAARRGMEKTRDMVAKKGRSSRLGERSKGTIDAGAASCFIILKAMGETMKESL